MPLFYKFKENVFRGSGTVIMGTFMIVGIFAFILMFMEVYQVRENYINEKAATDTIADGTAIYAITNMDYNASKNKADEISTVINKELNVDVGTVDVDKDNFSDDNTVMVSANPNYHYLTNLFSSRPSYSLSSTSGTQFTSYTEFLDYANVNEAQADVANKIYSVLKAIGWTNNQIAGALGNIYCESMFDYSSVETISELFEWGPRKQAAEACGYDIWSIDSDYARENHLIKLAGIGLIGWTDTTDGATGNTSLRKFADENNVKWYESLDLQLVYLVGVDTDGNRSQEIRNHGHDQNAANDDAETSARWWADKIEGCKKNLSGRINTACGWAAKIAAGDVTYDAQYANKILKLADINQGG